MLKEDEEIFAYALNIEYQNHILIYYLATIEKYRQKGYGTKFISMMKEYYYDKETMIIEIERLGYGENEKENEIMKKRSEFYHKSGFKEVGIVANIYCTDYEIYILEIQNNHNKDRQEEILKIEKSIYDFIIGNKVSNKHVILQKKKETH